MCEWEIIFMVSHLNFMEKLSRLAIRSHYELCFKDNNKLLLVIELS